MLLLFKKVLRNFLLFMKSHSPNYLKKSYYVKKHASTVVLSFSIKVIYKEKCGTITKQNK